MPERTPHTPINHGQSICRGHFRWLEESELQSVNTLLRLVLDVTQQRRARMLQQYTC